MIIRKLNNQDAAEHEKISSQSFVFKCEFSDGMVLPSENMLGAFSDDGVLLADMEAGRRKCFFADKTVSCAAVGGVASKPEYRNQGAIRKIFENLFCDESFDISILYPFSTRYYRKFGYAEIGSSMTLRVSLKQFAEVERNSNVHLCEKEDGEILRALYNKCAEKYNLCFVRENCDSFCLEPYAQAKYTYMWRGEDSSYRSYAAFTLSREESTVYVDELFFLDRESLLGIIGFLRCFDGNYEMIEFKNLPIDSPLCEFISEAKHLERSFKAAGMARVFDVRKILEKRKYPIHKGEFTVKCSDTIEKNNGVFHVEYENGTAKITKTDCSSPDVELSPEGFSRVLLEGISKVEDAEYMRGVKVNRINGDFFDAFGFSGVFLADGF